MGKKKQKKILQISSSEKEQEKLRRGRIKMKNQRKEGVGQNDRRDIWSGKTDRLRGDSK